MAREYSGMTAREIRNKKECGLHEALKIVEATRILNELDEATSLDEVKRLLGQFITMQTGIA